jgi:hypothetical protein
MAKNLEFSVLEEPQIGDWLETMRALMLQKLTLARMLTHAEYGQSSGPTPSLGRKCCANNCMGFLAKGICMVCQRRSCKQCMTVKEKDHICKPDDLKTAAVLKTNTKNCPKCNFGIFKISGCNVMFCTQCKTSFNWITLVVITSRNIHNPHYFEWITSQNTRTAAVVPQADVNHCRLAEDELGQLTRKYRIVGNMVLIVEQAVHRIREQYRGRRNIEMYLVQYIHKEIPKAEFVKIIQSDDKRRRIGEEKLNLCDVYDDCSHDIFVRISKARTKASVGRLVEEFRELTRYFETKHNEIDVAYGLAPRYTPFTTKANF